MNTLVQQQFSILDQTFALRHQVLDLLDDADLSLSLPGSNMTLGALCRESGQTDQIYIDSFKTGKQAWMYQPDADREGSVEKLREWYNQLEAELKTTIEQLGEDEIHGKMIDRGGGFVIPVFIQFQIYRESLLIFAAKATIYLKAMDKTLPQQLQLWIG